MSRADDVLRHVWELRAMMRRLGLTPPLPTSHVRKTVGRPRPHPSQRQLPRYTTPPDPMTTERKALVVTHAPGDAAQDTTGALTDLLNDGWRLLSTTAMGGAGGADGPVRFAALVVVEREKETSVGGFTAR